jgi:hypothetical protein
MPGSKGTNVGSKKIGSNKKSNSKTSKKSNRKKEMKEFITSNKCDPLLQIFETLDKTIYEYSFLLSKVTLLPIIHIDNSNDKSNENSKKNTDLLVFNNNVTKLQVMVQCYLQQQMCLSKIISDKLHSTLKSILTDENNQIDSKIGKDINSALNISEEFLKKQTSGGKQREDTDNRTESITGGMGLEYKEIFFFILIMNCLLFTSANSGSSLINLVLEPSTTNTGLVNTNERKMEIHFSDLGHQSVYYENTNEITNLIPVKSRATSLTNVFNKYDEKENKKSEKNLKNIPVMFQTFVQNFIQKPETGREIIKKYIETDFNKRAREISVSSENFCRIIMKDAYDNHLFEDYQSLMDIDVAKSEHEIFMENTNKLQNEKYDRMFGSLANAAFSFMNGDIITPITTAIAEANVKTYTQITDKPVVKKQNTKMEASELFEYSTILCSNTFWFNLELDEQNNIIIAGDRISYTSILELFYILNENMEYVSKTMDTDDKNKLLFKSLTQKLKMLEYIIKNLEQNVIKGNAYLQLDKRLRTTFEDPISEIIAVFNKEIMTVLEKNLGYLSNEFPVDEQIFEKDKIIDEQRRLLEYKKNMEKMEEVNFKTNEKIKQQMNDRQNWEMWAQVFITDNLNSFGKTATASVLALPKGATIAAAKEAMGTLNGVFSEIISTPLGITFLTGAALALYLFIAFKMKMIKYGVDGTIYIIRSPFIFTYKMIKGVGNTGYGALKYMGTIYDPKHQIADSVTSSSSPSSHSSVEETKNTLLLTNMEKPPPPPPPPPKKTSKEEKKEKSKTPPKIPPPPFIPPPPLPRETVKQEKKEEKPKPPPPPLSSNNQIQTTNLNKTKKTSPLKQPSDLLKQIKTVQLKPVEVNKNQLSISNPMHNALEKRFIEMRKHMKPVTPENTDSPDEFGGGKTYKKRRKIRNKTFRSYFM